MVQRRRSYSKGKSVRRLARERVGPVPPSVTLEPKTKRRKPKHRKKLAESELAG